MKIPSQRFLPALVFGLLVSVGCREDGQTRPPEMEAADYEETSQVAEEMLALDIRSALLNRLGTDALPITVEADGEDVLLRGTVRAGQLITVAEDVSRTAGAEVVYNQLQARPGDAPTPGLTEQMLQDAIIEATVKHALLEEIGAPAISILVDSDDYTVTLRGNVDDDAQRERAVAIAKRMDRVATVEDELELILPGEDGGGR